MSRRVRAPLEHHVALCEELPSQGAAAPGPGQAMADRAGLNKDVTRPVVRRTVAATALQRGHQPGDRAEDPGPRPAPDDRHRHESHRHPIPEEVEQKWRGQGCLVMSGRRSGRLAGFDPARSASATGRTPRSSRPTGRPTLAGQQELAPAGRHPRFVSQRTVRDGTAPSLGDSPRARWCSCSSESCHTPPPKSSRRPEFNCLHANKIA
jgi:hypothetical protein